MDRIWQWIWDRYGARYTWALCLIGSFVSLQVYLVLTLSIVGFERSGRYVEVTAVTVGAVLVLEYITFFPDRRSTRLVEQWASGHEVARTTALEATYFATRRSSSRMVWITGVWAAALSVVVGAIAGATASRLAQYGILGAVLGTGIQLIAYHNILEAAWRPVRSPFSQS